jgi:hypothetical protein
MLTMHIETPDSVPTVWPYPQSASSAHGTACLVDETLTEKD